MRYKTSGVCSSAIEFELDDQKKIHNVKFQGGCSGNTQGVARLVEGMEAEEAIPALRESAAVYVLHPARISYQKL